MLNSYLFFKNLSFMFCLSGPHKQVNYFLPVSLRISLTKSLHVDSFVNNRAWFNWHCAYTSEIYHSDQKNRVCSQLQIKFSHTSAAQLVYVTYGKKRLPRLSIYPFIFFSCSSICNSLSSSPLLLSENVRRRMMSS